MRYNITVDKVEETPETTELFITATPESPIAIDEAAEEIREAVAGTLDASHGTYVMPALTEDGMSYRDDAFHVFVVVNK